MHLFSSFEQAALDRLEKGDAHPQTAQISLYSLLFALQSYWILITALQMVACMLVC